MGNAIRKMQDARYETTCFKQGRNKGMNWRKHAEEIKSNERKKE